MEKLNASDWDAFLFIIFNLSVPLRENREEVYSLKKLYLLCSPERTSYKVEDSLQIR